MKPLTLYKTLYSHFGSQHWWPASTKFEVCIGAILTQNTAWQNVEKAIRNLRKEKVLSIKKIAGTNNKKLAGLIRSSGYYNQKAKRLNLFCKYLIKNYGGNLNKFFNKPIKELREELLSLHGIGEETADSIILYAAEKPSFVVDAYTKRFIERFYAKPNLSYVEVQSFFERQLPNNTKLFNEFHALIVEFCKRHCRKKPVCEKCFLNKECCYFC